MAIHRKILRWLENELFEGNIQLGQDLPNDSEIARAIGVGRSRTREALRTLEDMDLVQLYNGRGKEILVHLSDEPAAAASAALRLHMSSSRYPTRDLVQTRILLESWAIARIDPKTASFAEMDEVLAQMEDFDLSIRDFLELLLTFHHQVMRCAGNELLVGLLASVRQPSFESMLSLVGRMPLWSSAVERLRAESRAIAEALKAGDAATARAMVIGQLRGMYADAGIDLHLSPVQIQLNTDLGLFRIAFDRRSPGHNSHSSKRTRIEFACAVRCSASAKAITSSWMGSSDARSNSSTLMVLRKLSTLSGEKKRAVPEVGRT